MAVRSSFKNMVLCLGTVTLVCSALLAGVYVITEEPVKAAARARTEAAIAAVSPEFVSMEKLSAPDGTEYYVTRDVDGNPAGYVISASSIGFGGDIRLMVGIRPDGRIYDTAVIEHSETPGLGAKCTDESFAGQFRDFDLGEGLPVVRKDGGDVDAITAATITSRAYCAAIGSALSTFRAILPEKEPVQATDTCCVAGCCADSLGRCCADTNEVESVIVEGIENE